MASKQKEREPLQSANDVDGVDASDTNEAIPSDILPIPIAPEWNEKYKDPMKFDENEESAFFAKNDDGLFAPLFSKYSYCSVSKYFDDEKTIKENVNNDDIINFISYSKISFSTKLASIYHFVIELLKSFDNSDDIIFPWNLIYPQNKESRLPILSGNGLYFVKLFFCGKWRVILIDDNIPIFDEKLLFPKIADSNEMWPQLLSKAILKFLILSNRLNTQLNTTLIIELLTSNIAIDISQINCCNLQYKYICNLDEEYDIKAIILDNIKDWTINTALNNFKISDNIIENDKCWAIINNCWKRQTVDDLWQNTKRFSNDKTIFISNEAKEMEIILQINSLNRNLSEKVGIFIYDEANNIKKVIQITNMKHGFISFVKTIIPKQIYIIEVSGNISYSVTLYAPSSNVYLSPRFGNENIWNTMGYKMINIVSDSNNYQMSQTFVLFNIHIQLMNEECRILFHSVFNDEKLSNSLIIYCVNLDDYSMKLIPNLNLSTINIKQNKNGYSLIAFSRPNQAINNSRFAVKLLYKGDIEYNNIDMKSCLDFEINYIHNVDVTFMKDEIITDDAAKYIFCEVYFETNDNNHGEFGKIIEFIDKDTNDIVATYKSSQSVVYVPQILIKDSKLWFVIKFHKNEEQLFHDNSVKCTVRIISDDKIRLFPDNSQQIKFDKIKESWQTTKGRAETAFETRQKYLQKEAESIVVQCKQTQNKQSIIVNDEFWIKDIESKNKLLEECNKKIQNEQQFIMNQSTKMTDHNVYIKASQTESFTNIQKFTNNDSEKRTELRSERLEWNQKLSQIDTLYDGMNQNFEDLKQTLIKYQDEINKMIKPTAVFTLPSNVDLHKLIEASKNIERDVPKWLYQNKINDYNTNIYSVLYNVYFQINTQFAQLIHHKIKIKKLNDDLFNVCCDKYINLCVAINTSIYVLLINKWRSSKVWRDKLQDVHKKCENIMVDSAFTKLQSLIPMDTTDQENDGVLAIENDGVFATENDEVTENENDKAIAIDVSVVKEYLKEIQFASDSRSDIVIKERKIELSENYTKYIVKIEEWIQQKEKEQSMDNVAEIK